MGVAVVTDSTAYLSPPEIAAAGPGLAVVPLHVVIGGTEHREGVDVSVPELVEALRRFVPVSTSRPAPGEFLEVYRRLAAAGADQIVSVHLSAALSATVQGAQLAAAEAPVPVHVVDSRTIGGALAAAVRTALDRAAAGADPVQVAEAARRRAEAATVVFYVNTLEHLRRGGRIGAASALIGSALAIKPILGLQGGHIEPVDKVRTSSRALARMVELAATAAARAADGVDVSVQHLGLAERAEDLRAQLAERLPADAAITVGELGAVIGAHVGPGTLAIAVSPRPAP